MAELTFLFWNLRKEAASRSATRSANATLLRVARVTRAIADLALLHDVDVLVLAEMEMDSSKIIAELQITTNHTFSEAQADRCTKVKLFTRFRQQCIVSVPGASDERCTFREVDLEMSPSILMVAGHFLPKGQGSSEFMRAGYCRDIAERVDAPESNIGHQRTVLFGDLNMNPYEPGITGGLRAVMTRGLANKGKDPDTDRDTRFYNPMWQHYGETNGTPPGTYYRVGAEDEHFWNIYDQVLFRPGLFKHFSDSDIQILATAGGISLLTRDGAPRKEAISDHLPILFRLNL